MTPCILADKIEQIIQAFLVTVRNKKRVGYTYELTVRVKGKCCFSCNNISLMYVTKKRVSYTFYLLTLNFISLFVGEWLIGSEKKVVKGQIDIEEFSFGELDDLQVPFVHSLDLCWQNREIVIRGNKGSNLCCV